MFPSYTPDLFTVSEAELEAIPWSQRVEARQECFMSLSPREYTYGSGRGVRTYSSIEMFSWVRSILERIPGEPNVCFLNRYLNERNALGWHSDNSPDTSDEHPISVVSFGEAREIWWRELKQTRVDRLLLEPGSLFVMPAGFQSKYEHRIPKGSKKMGSRVSLTFRHMLDATENK